MSDFSTSSDKDSVEVFVPCLPGGDDSEEESPSPQDEEGSIPANQEDQDQAFRRTILPNFSSLPPSPFSPAASAFSTAGTQPPEPGFIPEAHYAPLDPEEDYRHHILEPVQDVALGILNICQSNGVPLYLFDFFMKMFKEDYKSYGNDEVTLEKLSRFRRDSSISYLHTKFKVPRARTGVAVPLESNRDQSITNPLPMISCRMTHYNAPENFYEYTWSR
jgi:hypothetical protein